jgi:hypothetical protein
MANTLMKGRPDPEWRLPMLETAKTNINPFSLFNLTIWAIARSYLQKWFLWVERCVTRKPEEAAWNNGPWIVSLFLEETERGKSFDYLLSCARYLAQKFDQRLPQEGEDAHTMSHRAVTSWLDWATWKVALSSDPKEILHLYGKSLQLPWRNTRKGNTRNAGPVYHEYGEAFYCFRQIVGLQLQLVSKNWSGWEGRVKHDRRLRKLFWELNTQNIKARDPQARHNEAGARMWNRHNQPATCLYGWAGGLQKEADSNWYRAYITNTNEDGTLLIESPFRFQHEAERTYNSQIRPLPHGHLVPTPLYSEGKFWGIEFNYMSNGTRIWGWEVRLNLSSPVFSRYRRNPGNPPEGCVARQGDVWLLPTAMPKESEFERTFGANDDPLVRSMDGVYKDTVRVLPERYRCKETAGYAWDDERESVPDYYWETLRTIVQVSAFSGGKISHPDHPSISVTPGSFYQVIEVGGVTTPWPRRGQQGD